MHPPGIRTKASKIDTPFRFGVTHHIPRNPLGVHAKGRRLDYIQQPNQRRNLIVNTGR